MNMFKTFLLFNTICKLDDIVNVLSGLIISVSRFLKYFKTLKNASY